MMIMMMLKVAVSLDHVRFVEAELVMYVSQTLVSLTGLKMDRLFRTSGLDLTASWLYRIELEGDTTRNSHTFNYKHHSRLGLESIPMVDVSTFASIQLLGFKLRFLPCGFRDWPCESGDEDG